MTEEIETERVSMVWPRDLKEKVREQAGQRGLTEFAIEAVELHLQGSARTLQKASKEVNETKWLVQQLADLVAMGGDSDKRLQGLMELQLPEWIETAGWPKEMADRVRPEAVAATPVAKEEPSALTEDAAPEVKTIGDDMLAKVMAKAKEKGVDLADIGLKPASQIPAPEVVSPAEPEEAPGEPTAMESAPAGEGRPAIQDSACATCGEELIDGECWTCT